MKRTELPEMGFVSYLLLGLFFIGSWQQSCDAVLPGAQAMPSRRVVRIADGMKRLPPTGAPVTLHAGRP